MCMVTTRPGPSSFPETSVPGIPLSAGPRAAPACDLLVLEATYGDRLHESREHRLERLGKILGGALADGGRSSSPPSPWAALRSSSTNWIAWSPTPPSGEPCRKPKTAAAHSRGGGFPPRSRTDQDDLLPFRLPGPGSRTLMQRGDHPLDFEGLYTCSSHRDHLRLIERPGPR